jgi:hypothetical protein
MLGGKTALGDVMRLQNMGASLAHLNGNSCRIVFVRNLTFSFFVMLESESSALIMVQSHQHVYSSFGTRALPMIAFIDSLDVLNRLVKARNSARWRLNDLMSDGLGQFKKILSLDQVSPIVAGLFRLVSEIGVQITLVADMFEAFNFEKKTIYSKDNHAEWK